jgi:hypothetical protein
MEKDIDKIPKNPETDIVIRVDDFGGRVGLTIREFVKSERYTGFTKAGTRIPAEHFKQFKDAINSIQEEDLKAPTQESEQQKLDKSVEAQKVVDDSNNSKDSEEEMTM